jgi:hypothetical protein
MQHNKKMNKNHNYEIMEKISIEEAIEKFKTHESKRSFQRLRSLVAIIQRDGLFCAHCEEVKGEFFGLGKNNPKNKNVAPAFHWDLYSADGHMLTIDHILAKANGGKNNLENLQLSCFICNTTKGCEDDAIAKEKIKSQKI